MINGHDNGDGDTYDADNNHNDSGDKIIMVIMLDSLCTKLCRSLSENGRRRCTAAPPKLENGILGYNVIIKIAITTRSSRNNDKNKPDFMGTRSHKKWLSQLLNMSIVFPCQ